MTIHHDLNSPSQSPAWQRRGPVGAAADRHIRKLQRGYRADSPVAVGTLARLRRGVGRPALDLADLWGLTGSEELLDPPPNDAPAEEQQFVDLDRAELALHVAVTLWALHQQSHREMDMHVARHGLGRAVRELMRQKAVSQSDSTSTGKAGTASGDEINEPLRKRFVRVSTANSVDALAARLREVVLLLRAGGIPLDYGLLADQLYAWQQPSSRAHVHRAWGRDFHLAAPRTKQQKSTADDAGDVPGQRESSDPYQPYGPLVAGD